MNSRLNRFATAHVVFFLLLATVRAEGQRIPVVPYPQEVSMGKGHFEPSAVELTVRLAGMNDRGAGMLVNQLSVAFEERFKANLSQGDRPRPDLWIGMPAADQQLMELAIRKGIVPAPGLGEEGYILLIEKRNIYILANGEAGAFYGVQSLRQLLRGYPDPARVPQLVIHDRPAIGFRCVMDDISRGPVPTNDYLKTQVRRYSEMKINHMSFYIEHVVRTERHPDFAPHDGGISIEEFRELSEYAADYHIKLVGNFQSLGHFEKILDHPQFRHLGATERMLDPLNPESIAFLRDIYAEMAPAFSSEFFTPNLDEAWDLSRGELTGTADSLGVARIYADHVRRIDTTLRDLGKRTIVWGDIIAEHPGILEMIPRDVVLGAWNYDAAESFAEYIDPLRNAGFEFTVSPGVLNSNRLIPDFNMTVANIRNFINEGYEKGTLGVYCTVWDDGGIHFFSHDWYGVAYNAEQCWRPNRDPLEDFDLRFSRAVYGDHDNRIPGTLHALNHLAVLGPTFEMNSNVFYKSLVPERGEKVTFNPDEWIEAERWIDESMRILGNDPVASYGTDMEFIRFTIRQYKFMADSRRMLLKAAEAYNQACALQRNDRAGAMERLVAAREAVAALMDRMESLAEDFVRLWHLESREYWLDRALLAFGKHRDAFQDQLNLLERAMDHFQQGAFLPPPSEVRLDIRRHAGQFFQYWLLSGSFSISTFDESSRDFLQHMGGEAEARPFPGMRFKGPSGSDRMWVKYDSPKMGEVDFKAIFEPGITSVAYAYCTIDSPRRQQVTALLGSNDGATVYCNGKNVYRVHVKRSLIPDEDEILLDLEEGRNHILIKVEQWKAGWGFSFRLKDLDVRNHKQKYFIQ